MTEVVSGFSNGFDHMRSRIAAALRDEYKKLENVWGLCGYGPDMEIVVAGFSEKSGPCAYIVCSHER
jgi:hypothetical protein